MPFGQGIKLEGFCLKLVKVSTLCLAAKKLRAKVLA